MPSICVTLPVVPPAVAGSPELTAATQGGAAFVQTVPEIAPSAVTFVTTFATLFPTGSGVGAVIVAVLFTEPLATVTLTTSVKIALAPLARTGIEQLTVPVPFTAGVAQPDAGVTLWNVVPAGTGSWRTTSTASSGPLLITAMV